jgi:integrase
MSAVHHRKKVWRYRLWVTLPNGTKQRITGTPAINTKHAALDAERAHHDRIMHPERIKPSEPEPSKPSGTMPLLREFAKRFLEEYAPDGKPGSNDSRRANLNKSIVPFFGHLRLDEIDQGHINAFKALFKGRSGNTLRNKLYALSALLRYASDLGIVAPHKLKLVVKKGSQVEAETEINAVSRADVAKLIKAAKDERYVVAMLLGTDAGMRIGEVRGAQWSDIKDGRITVRRSVDQRNRLGTPKNQRSRTIKLSPAILRALKKLPRRGIWILTRLRDDDDARRGQKRASAPGGFLGYSGMLAAVKRIYDRAGIKIAADIDPWHSFRHTFGTEMTARGVDVRTLQRLMDHADLRTTMRYITTTADQMDAAIDRAFG